MNAPTANAEIGAEPWRTHPELLLDHPRPHQLTDVEKNERRLMQTLAKRRTEMIEMERAGEDISAYAVDRLNRLEVNRRERMAETVERKRARVLDSHNDDLRRIVWHRLCAEAGCAYDSKRGKALKKSSCVVLTFEKVRDEWRERDYDITKPVEVPMPVTTAENAFAKRQPKGVVRKALPKGSPPGTIGQPFSAEAVRGALRWLVKNDFLTVVEGGRGRGRKHKYVLAKYALHVGDDDRFLLADEAVALNRST